MDSIKDAQADMRDAYFWGVPGVFCSACVWLSAAFTSMLISPIAGIWCLVFAGSLIFPASVALCKLLGYRGKHQQGNALAPLAIEGTIWMLLTIAIAVALAMLHPQYFFPAMLLIIAGRYLSFRTLYGLRSFYLLAFALVLAAGLTLLYQASSSSEAVIRTYIGAFSGAAIEFIFALVLFVQAKQASKKTEKTDFSVEPVKAKSS
ncbi:DUF7010 family protein [Agaribacterium haliotis]|uniref:DUF7010 family protein n=1 Tax=Agaribacterium haliotis TaxID=2013869 RepID=UPI000BB5748A|nr:hypothetical protein [Agaribacterium haliotis]